MAILEKNILMAKKKSGIAKNDLDDARGGVSGGPGAQVLVELDIIEQLRANIRKLQNIHDKVGFLNREIESLIVARKS